jgi:hypothetical protein
MYWAAALAAVTATPLLGALVLHTQITKLALWPAVILDELENDWTRTHSWEVLCPGAGEVGEPLGVGLGDVLELLLGVGPGLGLVELLPEADGDDDPEDGDDDPDDGEDDPDDGEPGLDEGLLLGDAVAEADGLADPDDELPEADADALPDAEALPDGDADALADAVRRALGLCRRFLCAAAARLIVCPGVEAVSTAFFGRDEHAVFAAGAFAASTASAWPVMPTPRKRNPASAPSASDLTISALTGTTSL